MDIIYYAAHMQHLTLLSLSNIKYSSVFTLRVLLLCEIVSHKRSYIISESNSHTTVPHCNSFSFSSDFANLKTTCFYSNQILKQTNKKNKHKNPQKITTKNPHKDTHTQNNSPHQVSFLLLHSTFAKCLKSQDTD